MKRTLGDEDEDLSFASCVQSLSESTDDEPNETAHTEKNEKYDGKTISAYDVVADLPLTGENSVPHHEVEELVVKDPTASEDTYLETKPTIEGVANDDDSDKTINGKYDNISDEEKQEVGSPRTIEDNGTFEESEEKNQRSDEESTQTPAIHVVTSRPNNASIRSPFYKKKIFWFLFGTIVLIITSLGVILPFVAKRKDETTSVVGKTTTSPITVPSTKIPVPTSRPTKKISSPTPVLTPSKIPAPTSRPTKKIFSPTPVLSTPIPSKSETQNIWIQRGQDVDSEAPYDQFGISVSQSTTGKILAVGANQNSGNGYWSGHVRIYSYNPTIYSYYQLGQDIGGEATFDKSGTFVSLSSNGMIVAIGAPYNDANGSSSGHVRVYSYVGDTWKQLGQDIDGEAKFDYFGEALSLSGNGSIVAIGAYGHNGNGFVDSGHVSVYLYNNNTWSQLGQDIDGEASNDQFGISVSLSSDGTIVGIGADRSDKSAKSAGHVRIYSFDNHNSIWYQLGQDILGEASYDYFGISISLSADGSVIAVGAYGNHGVNGLHSGSVRVFSYSNDSWSQLGQDIDGESANDGSGISVSLSDNGTIVAIGGYRNHGSGPISGQTRVYSFINSSWYQLGQDIDGEYAGDYSGRSVSLSGNGNTVAIGAYRNDGGGKCSGHVRVYSFVT